jgi:6-phosphogluconolactonase
MSLRRHNFADAEALAQALARNVAAWLSQAVKSKGRAVLAVSGGTTPQKFFEALSRDPIDWAKVTITLVDERQVDESSPRSNARLVKAALLQNAAAVAQFVPLYQNPAAAAVPTFDVVILGMGDDGHTASFFPGGDTLAEVLAKDAPGILPISAPGSVEPRLTFTLPRLLAARHLVLHIQGAAKEETLMKALGHGPIMEMPIRAVLRSSHELDVYWCP